MELLRCFFRVFFDFGPLIIDFATNFRSKYFRENKPNSNINHIKNQYFTVTFSLYYLFFNKKPCVIVKAFLTMGLFIRLKPCFFLDTLFRSKQKRCECLKKTMPMGTTALYRYSLPEPSDPPGASSSWVKLAGNQCCLLPPWSPRHQPPSCCTTWVIRTPRLKLSSSSRLHTQREGGHDDGVSTVTRKQGSLTWII